MTRDWEDTFRNWASPPSNTEQGKCDHAETAIRRAINASLSLGHRNPKIFAKGSYRNRTNVRLDSDVDICVLCSDSFFFDLPDGTTREDFDITPAQYSYAEYKDDIENALVSHFGRTVVKRGNKAFDIHENTYRIDADVVACFEHRGYYPNGDYIKPIGAAFGTDDGQRIVNWPEQNYQNGVAKNSATGRQFKNIVRILKRLRNEMSDAGHSLAESVPSYLIECLVWNVPNEGFGNDTYMANVRYILTHLFNETRNDEDCHEWVEINELKYLFRASQPWDRGQANAFLDAAWNYIGLE